MKFPYGISDFRKIISRGYFYCDRTDRIPLLENGEYLLFLRPRRFGKSLLLLYNDILYIMDSEQETNRRYSDLTMIIRPDMRRFKIFDVLIEFKFVKLADAKLTGEQARKPAQDELRKIPGMRSEMERAKAQVRDYGDALERKYNDLRLKRYVVVSLGFDRLWWKEVT